MRLFRALFEVVVVACGLQKTLGFGVTQPFRATAVDRWTLAAKHFHHSHGEHEFALNKRRRSSCGRREWLRNAGGFAALGGYLLVVPRVANARYVLDEETGDYIEVEDAGWQEAWKERLDKASTMSQEEIFTAARGAGNRPVDGQESPASRKRRALSSCRSAAARKAAGVPEEKDCTARVLAGETDFILSND